MIDTIILDLINDNSKKKLMEIKMHLSTNHIKQPVGIIGTGSPSDDEYMVAYNIGRLISQMGLKIICGGRSGIMEAACKGVNNEGGISIGILPETHTENSNKYVSIPITTGMGLSRNTIISCSSCFLISIGGSNGTLTEIAYGLQYNKTIFSIFSKFNLDDTIKFTNYNELIDNIHEHIKSNY